MNRLFRVLRTTLLVVLAVLLLLVFLVLFALNSSTLTSALLERGSQFVPGLSLTEVDGTLVDGLQANIRYATDTIIVSTGRSEVALDYSCLRNRTVCVETLHLALLEINLLPSDEPPPEPEVIELPAIDLPVAVKLPKLQVDQLRVLKDGAELYGLKKLTLDAAAENRIVSINELQATDPFCHYQVQGEVTLNGDYPLAVDVSCTAQNPAFPFTVAKVTANDSLAKLHIVVATTEGALQANLSAKIEPLQPTLPLQVDVQLEQPFTPPGVPADVQIVSANAHGEGTLENILLSADTQLETAQTQGPVTAHFEGEYKPDQLKVSTLTLQHAQGQINSNGILSLAPELHWQGESRILQFNLEPFVEAFPSTLKGRVGHDVRMADGNVMVAAQIQKLTGEVEKRPWQLDGSVNWQNQRLQVSDLRLNQAKNKATVNGFWQADKSRLQVKLAMEQLQELVPSLTGSVIGDLLLTGSLEQPAVKGKLSGSEINLGEQGLQTLIADLDWDSTRDSNNHIHLQADGIQLAPGFQAGGRLQLDGGFKDHQLTLAAEDSRGDKVQLECHGAFGSADVTKLAQKWLGDCGQLTLDVAHPDANQHWDLEQALQIELTDGSNVQLSPWCLRNQVAGGNASLCSKLPLRYQQGQLDEVELVGQQLPLAWAAPWLPEGLGLQGQLQLEASASMKANAALQASASINTDAAAVAIEVGQSQPLKVSLTEVMVSANTDGKQALAQWRLVTDKTGSTQGDVKMELDARTFSGEIQLENILVGPYAKPFLPEAKDEVAATVNGRVALAGSFDDPRINGEIKVSDGLVEMTMLPTPIRALNLDVELNNTRANVDGGFLIAEKEGQIDGFINWEQQPWNSEVHFRSGTLPYRYNDDISVEVAPDIVFSMAPGKASLVGNIHVPKARVYLKELPPSAVSVSPDVEIIKPSEELSKPSDDAPFELSTELMLTLGNDVLFEGFGLNTKVTGKLEVDQGDTGVMQANGVIRLVDGTYKAYGQDLTIREGDLIFIGDVENPQLRFAAVRNRLPDGIVVGIRVTGRARTPKIDLFSEPPMGQQAQFSYLLTGRAPNSESSGDPSQAAAEAALSMALSSQSTNTRQAGEKLGIEDLTITTESTENGSQVGLSGYITPDLMIRYGIGMFDAVNTITLNYRLRKNLFLEFVSGSANGVDLLYSFDRN